MPVRKELAQSPLSLPDGILHPWTVQGLSAHDVCWILSRLHPFEPWASLQLYEPQCRRHGQFCPVNGLGGGLDQRSHGALVVDEPQDVALPDQVWHADRGQRACHQLAQRNVGLTWCPALLHPLRNVDRGHYDGIVTSTAAGQDVESDPQASRAKRCCIGVHNQWQRVAGSCKHLQGTGWQQLGDYREEF